MRPRFLVVLPLLLASCGDPGIGLAEARLQEFHSALTRGDRRATRNAVTSSSRRFVRHLPSRVAEASMPLEVIDARREDGRIFLSVRDANPGAKVKEGTYVLAKERGQWLVDLVATAGANSHEEWNDGPPQRLVPTKLRPEQIRKARKQLEASARNRRH